MGKFSQTHVVFTALSKVNVVVLKHQNFKPTVNLETQIVEKSMIHELVYGSQTRSRC